MDISIGIPAFLCYNFLDLCIRKRAMIMSVSRIEFGSLVYMTIQDFSRLERNFCAEAGLYPGQPRILTILQDHEGLSLSALSPICGIGLPSLSVSLRNLQKSGLIRKEGLGKNQRIYLTNQGRQKAIIFHEALESFYTAFFSSVGEEAIASLKDGLGSFDSFLCEYNDRFKNRP